MQILLNLLALILLQATFERHWVKCQELPIEKVMEMNDVFFHLPNKRRIVKIIQVQRHGNRASKDIYSHLLPMNKQHLNFEAQGDRHLHPSALNNIQNFTEFFIRNRYDHLLYFYNQNLTDVNQTIFIRSTNKTRTVDSAYYQLRNLYYGLTREEIQQLINKEETQNDTMLNLDDKNCKLLKYVMNHAVNSEHQRKINDFVQWVSLIYLRKHIYDPRVVRNPSKDPFTPGEFSQWIISEKNIDLSLKKSEQNDFLQQSTSICSYIYWARQAGFPLSFFNMPENEVDKLQKHKEIENVCEMISDTKLYRRLYSSQFLPKMISYEFINQFLIPYLVKIRNQPREETMDDRLIFNYFMTHQEMLGPLFYVLTDKKIYRRVNPTSSLFIELIKAEGDAANSFDVSLIFMQDYKSIEHIETLKLDEFIKKLTKIYTTFRDVSDMKGFCKLRYTELLEKFQKTDSGIKDMTLMDADTFLKDLNKQFKTESILEEFEREYMEFQGQSEQPKDEL